MFIDMELHVKVERVAIIRRETNLQVLQARHNKHFKAL